MVIEAQVQSRYAAEAGRHARLVNGVLLNIVRAQSQFNVPLVTAAFRMPSPRGRPFPFQMPRAPDHVPGAGPWGPWRTLV